MDQAGSRPTVKLTVLVPAEVAEVYRHAAAATGRSMAQVIREALEDHAATTRAEAEISSLLDAGKVLAATGVCFEIAQGMMDEAVHAIVDAVDAATSAMVAGSLPDLLIAGNEPPDLGDPPAAEQRVPRRPHPSAGGGAAEAVPPAAEVAGADAVRSGSAMGVPDARDTVAEDVL